MLNRNKKRAIICSLTFLSSITYSATQGTLGVTSTGDADISASITDIVQISGLTDIDLGNYTSSALSATSNFCVYRNGTGKYSANLTGSGGITPGFFVKDTSGTNEIAYTVTIHDGVILAALPVLNGITVGTSLDPLTGDSTSENCSGLTPGTITVNISMPAINTSANGAYSGTLTILIAPL